MLLITLAVMWININHERWPSKNVIVHDVINYYAYLPAVFIEHDLSLSFLKSQPNLEKYYHYLPKEAPNGAYVIKTSMGMAILYLPFFLCAHLFANIANYPCDGFSEPYHYAILLSSLFYFLIGIYFLYRLMLRYFEHALVITVLFCITFATNVFYYLTIAGGLSHIPGFALFAAFLYLVVRWHEEKKLYQACLLGLICGLSVIVRPINGLMCLLFFLYGINQRSDVKSKWLLYRKYFSSLIAAALCFLIMVLPQMIYWYNNTGSFIFNSYVGEHFYFTNPHIFYGLLSFRKGWFIYTPLMLLALYGLLALKNPLPAWRVAFLFFMPLYLYVVFSWWCWWYGGSFGQRALIDIYPIMALSLAAAIFQFAKNFKRVTYSFLAFCLILNIWQTTQAKYNIIHYDSMTRTSYFKVLFTITKQEDREKYMQHPDYNKALRGEEEYQ